MSRLTLSAYWPSRTEPREACLDRAERFFTELATCDPLFEHWFRTGSTRAQALSRAVDFGNHDSLSEAIEPGPGPGLGYTINVWNGHDDHESGASLRIRCGGEASYSRVPNLVVIDLPIELPALADPGRARAMVRAVVAAWEPAWAGLYRREAVSEGRFKATIPFIEWLTYIQRSWLPNPPALPAPAEIEPLPGGSLIAVQPAPHDPASDAQRQLVAEVDRLVQAALKLPRGWRDSK